jgi:hypothetical protein
VACGAAPQRSLTRLWISTIVSSRKPSGKWPEASTMAHWLRGKALGNLHTAEQAESHETPVVYKVVRTSPGRRMTRRELVRITGGALLGAVGALQQGCGAWTAYCEEDEWERHLLAARQFVDVDKPGFIEAPKGNGPWKTWLPETEQDVYVLSFAYDEQSELICEVLIVEAPRACVYRASMNARRLPKPPSLNWHRVPISEVLKACSNVREQLGCTCDLVCSCNLVIHGPTCYCDTVEICTCNKVCTCDCECYCETVGRCGCTLDSILDGDCDR